MNNLHPRDAWRVAGILITVLLLLTFFLYQQTILFLIDEWNQLEEGEYGHGYLVLLISAYLIFDNRQRLGVLRPCPEYGAIVAVVLASMFWMMAILVDIEMLHPVGLLLLVLSIVWALLGTQVTWILVFPIFYIIFAIPVWLPLSFMLQELTASSVFWLVRVAEIPAFRIENMIVLPSGKLAVEEACSGLRYFLAALTLGTLYAYLNYRTFYVRLFVVLISAVTAVLANILRVLIIVYYGYKTEMQHPLIHDHVDLGWYLFGGLVVFLLVVESLLHRKCLPDSAVELDSVECDQSPCDKGKLQNIVFALVIAISIAASPVTVFWMGKQAQSESYPAQITMPLSVGEWVVGNVNEDDWMPLYRGAVPYKRVYSNKNNHVIHLYLGVYPTQTQGEELINDLNRISDNKVWHIRPQKAVQYSVGGQQVLEQLLEKDDGSKRLVWYWYHVAGQDTVNKYHAKALQILGLFNGKRQATIVAIAAKLDDDPEYTREILGQFAADMGPSLIRVIDN